MGSIKMIRIRRTNDVIKMAAGAVLVLCVLSVVHYMTQPAPLAAFNEELKLNRESLDEISVAQSLSSSGYHPSLNVVKSYPSSKLPYHDCVPYPESPRAGVLMCIYPPKNDIYVSKDVKAGKLFERDLVLQMGEALKSNKEYQFMDLGANLGVFTLYAAASGHSVLAVEMLPANVLQLQTSLTLSGLSGQVTLVNNALYSDHRELKAHFISANVGATHLNESATDFGHFNMQVDQNHTVTVRTICLNDLVPLLRPGPIYIKMDIERTEAKALTCADELFRVRDVRVIQMEWVAKSKAEREDIFRFMSQRGFRPSKRALRYEPEEILSVETTDSNNVFFIQVGL